MNAKLLSCISLFALLLVSTAVLADGRPTGLRIGRAVSGGSHVVQIDITMTGTNSYYESSNTAWLEATIDGGTFVGRRYASSARNVFVPYAIDWGDGSSIREVPLYTAGGPPFRGTFEHTYVDPGTYVVTVGDAVCCQDLATATINTGTGYVQTGLQYAWSNFAGTTTFSTQGNSPYNDLGDLVAIYATASVSTGAGIPALNPYGLLAMAFVLVGAGLLLFRRPQHNAF